MRPTQASMARQVILSPRSPPRTPSRTPLRTPARTPAMTTARNPSRTTSPALSDDLEVVFRNPHLFQQEDVRNVIDDLINDPIPTPAVAPVVASPNPADSPAPADSPNPVISPAPIASPNLVADPDPDDVSTESDSFPFHPSGTNTDSESPNLTDDNVTTESNHSATPPPFSPLTPSPSYSYPDSPRPQPGSLSVDEFLASCPYQRSPPNSDPHSYPASPSPQPDSLSEYSYNYLDNAAYEHNRQRFRSPLPSASQLNSVLGTRDTARALSPPPHPSPPDFSPPALSRSPPPAYSPPQRPNLTLQTKDLIKKLLEKKLNQFPHLHEIIPTFLDNLLKIIFYVSQIMKHRDDFMSILFYVHKINKCLLCIIQNIIRDLL